MLIKTNCLNLFIIAVLTFFALNSNAICNDASLVIDENGEIALNGKTTITEDVEIEGITTLQGNLVSSNSAKASFNGVDYLNWTGYGCGDEETIVKFTTGGWGATVEISAFFHHYGRVSEYGCVRKAFIGSYSAGIFEMPPKFLSN